jgi:rsbT co-antagonist protein RsbR
MRDLLTDVSRQRAAQGFSPSETASFVFTFKQPLFARIGTENASEGQAVQNEIWTATEILDRLGLYTIEAFQKTREEVILRQQQEMLELSTPPPLSYHVKRDWRKHWRQTLRLSRRRFAQIC